jgi:hypothetical protein
MSKQKFSKRPNIPESENNDDTCNVASDESSERPAIRGTQVKNVETLAGKTPWGWTAPGHYDWMDGHLPFWD